MQPYATRGKVLQKCEIKQKENLKGYNFIPKWWSQKPGTECTTCMSVTFFSRFFPYLGIPKPKSKLFANYSVVSLSLNRSCSLITVFRSGFYLSPYKHCNPINFHHKFFWCMEPSKMIMHTSKETPIFSHFASITYHSNWSAQTCCEQFATMQWDKCMHSDDVHQNIDPIPMSSSDSSLSSFSGSGGFVSSSLLSAGAVAAGIRAAKALGSATNALAYK